MSTIFVWSLDAVRRETVIYHIFTYTYTFSCQFSHKIPWNSHGVFKQAYVPIYYQNPVPLIGLIKAHLYKVY